ncbi:MAG: nucleoid-associated protein [Methanococcoides sp.]|nr:nucleoid-associated protein [Methanococcoides sp.]
MREDKEPPIYSEIESSLNNDSKKFLKSKLIKSIGSKNAHEISFDDGSDSPVPEIIKTLLNEDFDTDGFIALSKQISEQLNKTQSGINSAGFILILHGFNENKKVIGILKLEKEEGAQLKQSQRDGKNTFEITNIKDLILSKNTRLFKIGVFYKESDDSYSGTICDNQLTKKGDVAHFFLRGFLGCKLNADYAIETKNFFKYSIDFFKNNIEDPLIQNQYKLHLQSYVSSQSGTLNTRTFAAMYLNISDRNSYEKYLHEKDVPIQILKDVSYIEADIKKHLYEFENGIRIIGTNNDFEENVKLEPLENGDTRATVESRLENI